MHFLSFLFFISFVSAGGINPFSDDDLFSINWAGTVDMERLKTENSDLEIVSVQTEEDEKYQCVIPESQATIDANRKATYNGATPDELMEALFLQSSCSYRIESYWTYELCHGKHIKQYHENKELGLQKPKLQEYYLGQKLKPSAKDGDTIGEDKTGTRTTGDSSGSKGMEKDVKGDHIETEPQGVTGDGSDTETSEKKQQEIRSVKIDGLDLPFFSVNMTDGTDCDLTGKPRQSHIKYICQPNGRGEIYQLKETSSCEYDIIVLTSVLCQHPSFKPKDPPVSKINCHSVGTSPKQPLRLTKLQREQGIRLEPEDEEEVEEEEEVIQHPPRKPTGFKEEYESQKPVKVETNIGIEADKQLLRDFINGDYCIHGGGGWWKHEFCYNKHAKQYHEESSSSVTTIYLGHWDKQKHLDWLHRNPNKKPKSPENRKLISLFYSGGDVCDLTNKPRFVEVKLKCLSNPQQPHAVAIYLVEPASCEYVLGVESPLFCGLLEQADENGLFDHIKV